MSIRTMILALTIFSITLSDVIAQEKSKMDDALTVIHNRKSVRSYQNKEVTREQLEVLLKAAMAAPTAMDKRPWVFVVVTDRETLNKLSEGLPYAKMLKEVSAAVFVCGDTSKTTDDFWITDCSAASENLLLAAEATGLGAVWTAVYPDKSRINHVRKILGIPSNIIPLNCIPVGYPAGKEKPKDKWNPANIHWDKW